MEQPNYRQEIINRIEVPVEQREVTAESVKTAYLSAGSGPPVVCLHGAGAGAVTWYPSISALAEHFHVIAPDIVGYGESDKPNAAYDRPYFASWLRDFFLALEIPKAHVIGLSQGGAISLQFSFENPEMVEKLVLVDSCALGAKTPFGALFGFFWLYTFPSVAANRYMSRYLVAKLENIDPNFGPYSLQVVKKPGGKNVFWQGMGAAVSAMPEEELRQIQHQTLIIWGEDDNFLSIASGEAAAQIMPNAKLHRIQDAGHIPFMDQPEVFNDVVLQFLRE
jgi:4,5:9,10-diseco-3-hydroxy-5,9,17-trioxoandrosta-1(10),2-diene-4-oate hydrolase